MLHHTKLKPFEAWAHINSLAGDVDKITVLEEVEGDPRGKYYIVDYKGVKCTAIFNWFTGAYYADDKYGRIKQ